MSSEELKTFTPLPSNPQRYHDDDPLLNPKPLPTTQTRIMVPTQSTIQDLDKTYAPYVRHDLYGTMGRAHLSLNDKFLLGIGLFFLFPVRVFLGTFILFIYYLICRFCTAFREPNGEEGEQEDYAHVGGWRRIVMLQGGRYLSRLVLFVFGFYWIQKTVRRTHHDQQGGDDGVSCNETTCIYQPEDVKRPGAIVSNHVSYVDILYHMSTSFPSFVAKRSVGKLPLVGLISKCLGCVYVQRESKSADFKGVSAVVNERIRDAHQNKSAPNIMLFPEGTTTNGGYLLPFKTGAFLAKAPLRPVLLKYPYQRFSPAWDSISGVRHVILLLCQFVNRIEVTQLPVYHPSEQEKEQPKLYAENVRRMMAHEGNLILSDLGLPEKRVYHAALNGKIIMPTALHQKAE